MQTLIDDLLLLARLDEGRPLATERVDLVAVLEDAVDAARAVGPDWPITFGPPAPVEVIGDSMALRQIIDNLLGNVRTHTPPGTPRPCGSTWTGPRIRAGWCWRSRTRVRVSTPSTSSGSSSASTASTRPDRGSRGGGLGLAVVAALVAAHHGQVEVLSEPGEGATFRVHLALAPTEVCARRRVPVDPPGRQCLSVTRSSGP